MNELIDWETLSDDLRIDLSKIYKHMFVIDVHEEQYKSFCKIYTVSMLVCSRIKYLFNLSFRCPEEIEYIAFFEMVSKAVNEKLIDKVLKGEI